MDAGTITSIAIEIIKFVFKPLTLFLKWVIDKLPFEMRWKRIKLGIIESRWGTHTWDRGKQGDEPVVFVHTRWSFTNTLPYNITALNAFLTKPQKVKGHVLIKNPEADIYGSYVIPSGYTTEVHADFAIDNDHGKSEDKILKINIDFQDSIGRLHKVRNVDVYPIKVNAVKQEKLAVENSSKITNETERKLVSVLKNEIQQYKVRGRREGGLGTVDWPRGTIEWTQAGSTIQFLFQTSSEEHVRSEHATALLNLYKNASKGKKKIFIQALLDRIDRKSEYRDVAYLIIFVLFLCGFLKEGLVVAKKDLLNDKAHGFSDMLRLIDLLLAFRYQEFDDKALNEIEKLVFSVQEHPFRIKERVNAVRVKGLVS